MNNHTFFKNLDDMLAALYPILYLETSEFERSYRGLKSIAAQGNYKLLTWNSVQGLSLQSLENDTEVSQGNNFGDLEAVFQEIHSRLSNEDNEIFVLEDVHDHMEDINHKVWLRKLGEELKYAEGKKHLILLSPILKLPREIEKYVTVLSLPLPGRKELGDTLFKVRKDAKVNSLSPGMKDRLIDAGLGMTEQEADLAYCLAWKKTQLGLGAPDVVMKEKEQIIKKSGILEFIRQSEDMKNIGGLINLKKWLDKRGVAFSPAARNFHLSEPKGIMLLGVPGCGKSLTAKAISSRWNMPLLRLDIGKVFEGLVGSSESNIRTAIKTAEAVAPCVLWIDEIEKGLAGTGNSGSTDSGVTARVFSTMLTWMQEKKAPVFVVATANGIEHLPPELLRKGRFDGIFFVDLPTQSEREEIFRIHLDKKGQDSSAFPLENLAKKTLGFNGAEIAELVNEALFEAFNENMKKPVLKTAHLMGAIKETVILATTMRERIDFLRKWSVTRAMPAGELNQEELPTPQIELSPQERRRDRKLNLD